MLLPPSFEDAVPIRMDGHCRLGENYLAVEVSKRAQADEGMGGGWHHLALHRCRWKRWGRGQDRTGDRSFG
jgi:hypothetical protein